MKAPNLTSIPSTGPKLTEFHVDGQMYVDQRSTPCPVCRKHITAGEDISSVFGSWAHAACATDSLIRGGAEQAWLALGSDLARHPRGYKTAETRLIINQLLRIAASMQPDEADFEDGGA